jgi:hypothetical protein
VVALPTDDEARLSSSEGGRMRSRLIPGLVLVATLAAACGGGSTASEPGASSGTDASPAGQSTAPASSAPSSGGSGGGGGGDADDSVTFEISGAVSRTDEFPYYAPFSRWQGDPAGMYLLFSHEGSSENLTVYEFQGTYLVGFLGDEFGLSTPACDVTNVDINDSSASGDFDCQGAQVVTVEGEMLSEPARITGSFSASR